METRWSVARSPFGPEQNENIVLLLIMGLRTQIYVIQILRPKTYPFQISLNLIIPNIFCFVTVDSWSKQTTLIILLCPR